MPEYRVAFNEEWVPDHTPEQLSGIRDALRPLLAEMRAAGVLVFTGGLDPDAQVVSVDLGRGSPVVTDGPFVETKEVLGGLAILDVADEAAAREWAARIAVACGWLHEVRRFRVPRREPGSEPTA